MKPNTVPIDFPDADLRILADGDWRGFRSSACKKEPETVEWLRSIAPGLTDVKKEVIESGSNARQIEVPILWDIGASVGSYSLIAAALGLQVIAFEPFAPSYGQLQQNIWLNSFDEKVTALPFGVGEATRHAELDSAALGIAIEKKNEGLRIKSGMTKDTRRATLTRLNVSSTSPGAASHGSPQAKHFQWMSVISADETARTLCLPDHVKIDVDGAEMGVIESGRSVWQHVQSIMVESEPGVIENIEMILAAAGLRKVAAHKRLGDTQQHNYLFWRE